MEIFDTHKFLFTLNYENKIKNCVIKIENNNNEKKEIIVEKIEITSSPVSCKIYDKKGIRHIVPFHKILEIKKDNETIWIADQNKNKKVKIIKGYK